MPTNNTNILRGYPIALLSAVVLSTTAILARILTEDYQMPALVLAVWRAAFVTLTLLLVLGIFKPGLLKVTRAQLGYLLIYGFILAIFNSFWTISVALNGAAVSNVLVYCSTRFTVLLGWFFLKEKLSGVKIGAVVLCIAGTVFVSRALNASVWAVNMGGIVTGVISGLMYAIYSLMGRSASQRGLNPWTTMLYTFIFDTGFLLLANLLPLGLPEAATAPADLLWLGDAWVGWGYLLLLAAGPTVIGYGLYMVSLSLLPSSTANLIVTLEPVLTVVMAFVLLGEKMEGIQIGGALLILLGIVWLRLYEGRQMRRETAVAENVLPVKAR